MAKYIGTKTVTISHSYVIEAESKEEAEQIFEEKDPDVDFFDDDSETEYSVREEDGEDLSYYDRI